MTGLDQSRSTSTPCPYGQEWTKEGSINAPKWGPRQEGRGVSGFGGAASSVF